MDPKLARNYRQFTRVLSHDTRVVRARTIRYGCYDEDTAAVMLAMIGLTLMVVTILSTLVVFAIF
jgi:hypothetical protein